MAAKTSRTMWFDMHQRTNVNIDRLPSDPQPIAVWVQSLWNTPADEMKRLIETVRRRWPHSPVIYLDWFAPTDLRNTYLLEICDAYIKKHVLHHRERYIEGFHDTNLVEYESQWNEAFLKPRHEGISTALLEKKLIVGWNFATDYRMIRQLRRSKKITQRNRPIDLHCRIAAPSSRSTWYGHMRGRCFDAAKKIKAGNILVEAKRLTWSKYMQELRNSKLCFSPFGYGEVCWRDFEAIASGAVLVKPDMSHIETWPNIYIPHVTYVPVRWDLSDLESVCERYLMDESTRSEMTENAKKIWLDSIGNHLREYWTKLNSILPHEGFKFNIRSRL